MIALVAIAGAVMECSSMPIASLYCFLPAHSSRIPDNPSGRQYEMAARRYSTHHFCLGPIHEQVTDSESHREARQRLGYH